MLEALGLRNRVNVATKLAEPSLGFFLVGRTFGGAERRNLRLANHVAASNRKVILICNPEVVRMAEDKEIPIANLTVVALPGLLSSSGEKGIGFLLSRLRVILAFLSSIRALRDLNLSHLHIISNPNIRVLFFSLFFWAIPPFSFSFFGSGTVDRGVRPRFASTLALRLGLAVGTGVDCLTPDYAEYCKKHAAEKNHYKVHLAPCSFTDYSQAKDDAVRDIDVLFLGRFVEGKGLIFLGEIVPKLEAAGISLHVCGFGPLRNLAPGPNVYETDEPFAVMARSRVFLSIQEYENYPSQSLLEAMASGCAIVATNVGNTRLILDDSVADLVEPNAEAIFRAIEALIRNPARAEVMGAEANKKARRLFTIERYSAYFVREILER